MFWTLDFRGSEVELLTKGPDDESMHKEAGVRIRALPTQRAQIRIAVNSNWKMNGTKGVTKIRMRVNLKIDKDFDEKICQAE